MSQRTSNFDWKSSSYIMIHQLQDIRDNGRHWNWLHVIIGGLVLPCRSKTIYQDVTVVKEWSLFWKGQQKSLSPMKLLHNLGKILPQALLQASQKHKDTMCYLSHVAVIQNRHILFLHLQPTLARGLVTLFRDHIWKLHGFPETALLDRGPQFTAEFMKELNEILGIKTKLSTAYHPQTDRQTEQVNQEIEQYLRMFVSHRQNDWPEWIACTEFTYYNKIHTATHISPFFANYRMNPRMGIEPQRAGKSEPAKEFAEQIKLIHEEAQVALSKARDDMTHYADFHRGQAPEYKVGNKVWLSIKNLNVDWPSRKLTERQLGPYEIIKIISSNAVKLKLPALFKIHNVINVSCIHPYHPPVAGQSIIPSTPVTVEGTPEYKVEEIVDSWLKCDKLEFLVK